MWHNPRWPFALGGLAGATAVAVSLAWAQPEPKPKPEPVAVRQARAQLRLTEANLNKLRRMNQRVARSVAADVVAEYEQDVAIAQARLDEALRKPDDNPFGVWLQAAEVAVKTAETRLRSAEAANKRMAGTFDQLDLERLRLRADLAQLRLERGRELADQPAAEQLQWQVGVLADEVQRLREQLRRAPPSGGIAPIYPLWWY